MTPFQESKFIEVRIFSTLTDDQKPVLQFVDVPIPGYPGIEQPFRNNEETGE